MDITTKTTYLRQLSPYLTVSQAIDTLHKLKLDTKFDVERYSTFWLVQKNPVKEFNSLIEKLKLYTPSAKADPHGKRKNFANDLLKKLTDLQDCLFCELKAKSDAIEN